MNPLQLTEDIDGIITDNLVVCCSKCIIKDKILIPVIEYVGDSIVLDETPFVNGKTKHDFSNPFKLTIFKDNNSKDYFIYLVTYTGLPIIWIETKDREDILSKDKYIRAEFVFQDNLRTKTKDGISKDSLSIKGRGHSSWTMQKKPYRLKFDNKQSILGMPKDKSWVLLSNYSDKTMIRNQVAFFMGTLSNLDYTPRSHYVELFLNGSYNGTYLFCGKIKIDKERVDVGENGFLMEIDYRAPEEEDSRLFYVPHLERPINIKEPSLEYDDESFNYVKNYLEKADSVLFSDGFKDPDFGWQKYFAINSFVEWFLINEISRNNDARMFSSCYMTLTPDGKLKMGPIWDFDIAFGNINYNGNDAVSGFWVKTTQWYSRFFEDKVFVDFVKSRFVYYYERKDDILRFINDNASYLMCSISENENKWHTLYTYTWPNYNIEGNYINEVQYLKEWINERFEWLKSEFEEM